jgi:uncharacterized protein YjiS (DUF1127 family)
LLQRAMQRGRPRNALALVLWPLERLIAAQARWRERQALTDLDDRLLRDVGVTRAEIAGAFDNPRAVRWPWGM